MLKLVQGVINFHRKVLPGLRQQFAQLASGQAPDVLMVACSDSRVVPNLFASTDPGDLFVVRNPGNLVPPAHPDPLTPHGDSEAAAIEIALEMLHVKDIIVCGHSGCAGMAFLMNEDGTTPNVKRWIRHGQAAKQQLDDGKSVDPTRCREDQLSQLNVLSQLDHLATYRQVRDGVSAGTLRLHAWWFDVGTGNVYAFEPHEQKFLIIDETEGARILRRLR